MSVFLITYDLNKPGQDYDKILGVIKGCDYVMLCKSSYVVDIENLSELIKEISKTFDKSTDAYIFPITDPIYFEFGSKKAQEWLKSHLG